MPALLHDLRLAFRTLARNRAFAFAAVTTLALGIGANGAIFSITNAVFFRPLPYPSPERLVAVWETNRDVDPNYFADPKRVAEMTKWLVVSDNFERWKQQQHSFEAMGGFFALPATLTGGGEPERVPALLVTPGALGATRVLSRFLFGVKPADPVTFAAVSLVLIAVAVAAGYFPARRASALDPMAALRYE